MTGLTDEKLFKISEPRSYGRDFITGAFIQ
jgi:hypothetical protein